MIHESVFNIEPENLIIPNLKSDFNYDFLDFLTIDPKNYYYLLNSYDEFKLKNIYQFLYLRSLKINIKYQKIEKMIHNKDFIKPKDLNDLLNNYIQKNILKSIFIINSIQLYYNY